MKLLGYEYHVKRWSGMGGGKINIHRAIRVIEFPFLRWLEVLVIPALMTYGLLKFLPLIVNLWGDILIFWVDRMDLPIRFTRGAAVEFFSVILRIPRLQLLGGAQTEMVWLMHFVIAVGLYLTSLWLPEKWTPVAYILKSIVIVGLSSLTYFYFSSARFSFDQDIYTSDLLLSCLVFLMIIPWLLAMTYYIFPFKLMQKIGFTLLALGYFCIFAPLQVLMHVLMIYYGSVLMLPFLYICFGIFMNIMLLMAFYGWMMSYQPQDSKKPNEFI